MFSTGPGSEVHNGMVVFLPFVFVLLLFIQAVLLEMTATEWSAIGRRRALTGLAVFYVVFWVTFAFSG